MKIVLVCGQNHKGSTYHVGRCLAEKLGGEIVEFFLPKDFGEYCVGCTNCFMKGEDACPHYQKLHPITKAMDDADVLIFASPVYVYHVTGSMKSFLDHYGYRWMVHRPEEKMFAKQAVCISTAAGAGCRTTDKDMADSLFFWGVPKIYRYGLAVQAVAWKGVKKSIRNKMEKDMDVLAKKINRNAGRIKPGIKIKSFFFMMHLLQRKGFNEADRIYWKEKGWTGRKRPWK